MSCAICDLLNGFRSGRCPLHRDQRPNVSVANSIGNPGNSKHYSGFRVSIVSFHSNISYVDIVMLSPTIDSLFTPGMHWKPDVRGHKTPEQREAAREAQERWRFKNRDRHNAIGRKYRRMQRALFVGTAWVSIIEHYGKSCLCCGSDVLTINHVTQLSQDSATDNCLANIQPLCHDCDVKRKGEPIDYRLDRGAWIVTTFPNANEQF